ncbi:GYF domain-containing protein [Fuerstiella marisgermanici]|uniref:GYF domain-containing protein n=1 Tax=Fuerstiella marisgermanici TaxID=1891926 RepID=A0A1P8WM20_9PLAN|nr:GYF domain-containing protein [Fuerstiella marisgermanici]APZ95104.1 hypothetical protein Fuma_04758 [Fuerstiella marisgermanici]
MPAQRWYYELLSQEFGPVAQEQIDDLVTDGTLAPTDRVRKDDSELWTTVAQMHDEQASDGHEADPGELSDLSELSFSFEDNTPTGPAPDELDIDSFSIEGDSESTFAESEAAKRRRQKLEAPQQPPEADTQEPVPERATEPADPPAPKRKAAQPKKKATSKKAPSGRPLKKKKRRKKKQEDEFLSEIFSEVFTEDGAVKPDHQPGETAAAVAPIAAESAPVTPPAAGAAAPAMPSPGAPSPAVPAPQISQPAATSATAAGSSAAATALAGGQQASGAVGAAAAIPTRPPVPPPKKKKRGGGFTLPTIDAKVAGIVAGVLLLAAVVGGGMMGYISLPGLAVDEKAAVMDLYEEYKSMSQGTISPDQWGNFSARARDIVTKVNRQLAAKGGSMTPQEFKLRAASQRLGMLASADFSNDESRTRAWAAVEEAMKEVK